MNRWRRLVIVCLFINDEDGRWRRRQLDENDFVVVGSGTMGTHATTSTAGEWNPQQQAQNRLPGNSHVSASFPTRVSVASYLTLILSDVEFLT